ncbi:MAG: esterase YqiA, partial [Alteromonadaceae bacterium]
SYWLMVQSEDETLDYRWAVEAYQGSKQLVEEGGSHAFEGYEKHLPEMLEFFLNG